MPDKIKLPKIPEDGDSRDSSLIVYTLTVAIAVALFVGTFSFEKYFDLKIKAISAIILTVSIILVFLAIEYLVDITSFGNSNDNTFEEREKKYKKTLCYYNWSVILIIGVIILLSINFLAFAFLSCYIICHYYSCVILSIIVLAFIVSFCCTRKWQNDLCYLKTVEFIDGNKEQKENKKSSKGFFLEFLLRFKK